MTIRLVTALFVLLAAIPSGAADLFPGKSNLDVATDVYFYIDESSLLTLSELEAVDMQKNTDPSLNLGNTQGHVWLKLHLTNAGTTDGSWLLSFNRAVLNALEVYVVRPGSGGPERIFDIRVHRTERESLRRFGTLATPVELHSGETATYFVRDQGPNSSALPITVEPEADLIAKRSGEVTYFIAVAAGVLTLIVYNALMYGLTGDRPFLYYTFAQTAVLLYFAHIEGMTTVYLWPDNPRLGGPLAPILGALICLSVLLFARSFLETAKKSPHWDRVLRWSQVLSCVALVVAVSAPGIGIPSIRAAQATGYLLTIVTWLVLPALAIKATASWQIRHWPLIPAWLVMSSFVFYTIAVFAGVAEITKWHPYLYGLVSYSEAGFLSIALALRIRALREHSLETERALSASLERELDEARRANELSRSRSAAMTELAQQGQLIRAASHDSRQMVATLQQAAYALEHGGSSDQTGELLKNVATYLDDVLTTTTNGSYTGGLEDSAVALETISGLQLLRPLGLIFERLAAEKGIGFRLRSHDLEVVTDRALLLRILSNLASNAIKYCDQGGVLITVRRRRQGVLFQVHDTGHGMSEGDIAILLARGSPAERFEADGEGSGTGWQVVRGLVERLNGVLTLKSVPARGTTVSLFLKQEFSVPIKVSFVHGVKDKASLIDHLVVPGLQVKAVAERQIDQSDRFVVVDLDTDSMRGGLDIAARLSSARRLVVVATYDHDLALRKEISGVTPFLLYKPVTPEALQVMSSFLSWAVSDDSQIG